MARPHHGSATKHATPSRVGILTAGLLVAVTMLVPASGRADPAGLALLGKLPLPKGFKVITSMGWLGIDVPNRRFYVNLDNDKGDSVIAEYDVRSRIPTLQRTVPFDATITPNQYGVALDSAGHRMFAIGDPPTGVGKVIKTLDLTTLKYRPKPWDLETQLPGFDPLGITYSAHDKRVYVAGMFVGGIGFASGLYAEPLPALPVGVAALDAATGKLVWWKAIPQCQMLGGHFDWGAPVFRSARYPAIYLFCVRPSNQGVEAEYPGESGLVRLWIDPAATQKDASGFRVEFFPVGGHFVSGAGISVFATFDPTAERYYVVNQSSTTPGMWAFDGTLPAWVGFVGTDNDANYGLGVDPTTGHVFVQGSMDNVIVTAGRATPVPQGEKFPYSPTSSGSLWLVDGPTHRVFVQMQNSTIDVLLDRTSVNGPDQPIDYDSLTSNVPESQNTVSTFAGDAGGFGARVLMVGGYGGVVNPLVEGSAGVAPDSVGGFSPGDRSITAANVPSVDLRDTGAAASAQAVAPDSLSQNDYATTQTRVQDQGNKVSPGTGDQMAGMLNWQWPAATCLDAGDQKVKQSKTGPGGDSSVLCDLNKAVDTASASYTGLSDSGVTVGSSSFEATSRRDPKLGIVTRATAITKDVHIVIDGGGSLIIQRVEANATTYAHGRTGTSKAVWKPLVEGVTLRDASGKVIFTCPQQCDPHELARQVDESELAVKLRVLFPSAQMRSTPHGAFAGVGKTDPDYWSGLTMNDDNSRAVPAMQIELYNDYGQKSRLVLQLAAIQATSIYGISLLPTFTPGPVGGPTLPTIVPPLVHTLPPPTIVGVQPAPQGGVSILRRLVHGAGVLVRSPLDAVMFGLVCLLFGGAAAVARRRKLLASSLEEASR